MPTFSLIVATMGRTTELSQLFQSIVDQGYRDLEVIVVDQNTDDRVLPVMEAVAPHFPCSRLRAEPGVSAARNLGLAAATGELVAFPDDDCWYPAGLLANVAGWFGGNPSYAVLAVGAEDEEGISSGNRWIQSVCDITPFNSLRTTFCSSLFLRRGSIPPEIRFDPKLARGEETDFILYLLKAGRRGRFDRTWHVCHPRRDMLSGTVSDDRAFSYGAGMGSLARRHSLFALWICLLGYDLLRAVAVGVKGQITSASRCLFHSAGLFTGFVKG